MSIFNFFLKLKFHKPGKLRKTFRAFFHTTGTGVLVPNSTDYHVDGRGQIRRVLRNEAGKITHFGKMPSSTDIERRDGFLNRGVELVNRRKRISGANYVKWVEKMPKVFPDPVLHVDVR